MRSDPHHTAASQATPHRDFTQAPALQPPVDLQALPALPVADLSAQPADRGEAAPAIPARAHRIRGTGVFEGDTGHLMEWEFLMAARD